MNRNLKIGYNTRITGIGYNHQTKFFPKLILQGDWMQEAGFNIGDQTAVTVSNGKIEITLTKPAT